MNFSSNKTIPILLALTGLVGGILLSLSLNNSGRVANPVDIPGLLWPNPKQISDFQLIDQNAETFDLEKLKGHWSMIFFGYTHCPDICPTTMTLLDSVIKDLTENNEKKLSLPQIIFVSIDPKRDTQEHLAEYITYFNPAFYGLTGSEQNISSLTKQLGILYMEITNKDPGNINDYLMDHSSSILLLDPEARLVGIFSAPHNRIEIKKKYLAIRKFIDQQS